MRPRTNADLGMLGIAKMDWLTFIASMTKYLAWPVVVSVLIAVFRKPILSQFLRLAELTFPGGSVKFDNKLIEASETGEKAAFENLGVIIQGTNQPIYNFNDDPIVELARTFPEAAVIESFKEVEASLLKIKNTAHRDIKPPNIAQYAMKLRDENVLGETHYQWFQELRSLRNLAAHSGPHGITPAEAVVYREQCRSLANYINELPEKLLWRPDGPP
jgi:hypothetical protein